MEQGSPRGSLPAQSPRGERAEIVKAALEFVAQVRAPVPAQDAVAAERERAREEAAERREQAREAAAVERELQREARAAARAFKLPVFMGGPQLQPLDVLLWWHQVTDELSGTRLRSLTEAERVDKLTDAIQGAAAAELKATGQPKKTVEDILRFALSQWGPDRPSETLADASRVPRGRLEPLIDYVTRCRQVFQLAVALGVSFTEERAYVHRVIRSSESPQLQNYFSQELRRGACGVAWIDMERAWPAIREMHQREAPTTQRRVSFASPSRPVRAPVAALNMMGYGGVGPAVDDTADDECKQSDVAEFDRELWMQRAVAEVEARWQRKMAAPGNVSAGTPVQAPTSAASAPTSFDPEFFVRAVAAVQASLQQRGSGGRTRSPSLCFACQQPGHRAVNCPTSGRQRRVRRCFKCGSTDHVAVQCSDTCRRCLLASCLGGPLHCTRWAASGGYDFNFSAPPTADAASRAATPAPVAQCDGSYRNAVAP